MMSQRLYDLDTKEHLRLLIQLNLHQLDISLEGRHLIGWHKREDINKFCAFQPPYHHQELDKLGPIPYHTSVTWKRADSHPYLCDSWWVVRYRLSICCFVAQRVQFELREKNLWVLLLLMHLRMSSMCFCPSLIGTLTVRGNMTGCCNYDCFGKEIRSRHHGCCNR